jgi:hypothetical protein
VVIPIVDGTRSNSLVAAQAGATSTFSLRSETALPVRFRFACSNIAFADQDRGPAGMLRAAGPQSLRMLAMNQSIQQRQHKQGQQGR